MKNMPNSDEKVDQFQFLKHRKLQEKEYWNKKTDNPKPLDSILTVEINTTELCNRKCEFCPRFDSSVFPNRNLNLSKKGASTIAKELARNQYQGKISFSGFGENLLNPEFIQIVKIFSKYIPDATLECNTNGDKLNKDYLSSLFSNSGLDYLYINLYDGPEQIKKFEKIVKKAGVPLNKVKYRMHWGDVYNHGLILNNRSGTIDWIGIEETEIEKLKNKPCYYPFYKMFVDWNGDVLFCSNDWGRENIIGNLFKTSLHDVWFSPKMKKIRENLINGNRTQSPCNKCSVDGTLFGQHSYKLIKKYYEDFNNREK